MKSIQYYDNNAQSFYDRTINLDLSDSYNEFISYLPNKANILDAGCGAGRDTNYFLNQGYKVTAIDASAEMVKLASKETGINVHHLTFQNMNFEELFDGVWAQASLLHVPYNETKDVYKKIHKALKPNGIFYACYSHGEDLIQTDERDFYNMNENSVKPYFDGLFDVIKIWVSNDNRVSASKNKLWFNFIVRKKN